MKLSAGSIGAVMGGRGGDARGGAARGADGRGGSGRGGPPSTATGRGADVRGGASTARGSTAGGSTVGGATGGEATVVGGRAGGRGADGGRGTDPQVEAMRAALSGGLQQIEYMTRRGKIRIAVVGATGAPSPAAMIYMPDEGIMYTLIPPLSMYSETSIADMQGVMATVRPGDTSAARVPPRAPTVIHTKQFELIAGHKCEHVTVTLGKQKTDICMGKGLGVFVMPAGFGRAEGWDQVMTESNGFPLKVMQANGTVTMEVTKIERKALPESLFSVPDSYSKMPDFTRRPPG